MMKPFQAYSQIAEQLRPVVQWKGVSCSFQKNASILQYLLVSLLYSERGEFPAVSSLRWLKVFFPSLLSSNVTCALSLNIEPSSRNKV